MTSKANAATVPRGALIRDSLNMTPFQLHAYILGHQETCQVHFTPRFFTGQPTQTLLHLIAARKFGGFHAHRGVGAREDCDFVSSETRRVVPHRG